MTTNHTPGPWRVELHDMTTSVESQYFTICADVTNDDAGLIAAAPDLLAALENLVETHDTGEAMCAQFWNIARAAIARAKGE